MKKITLFLGLIALTSIAFAQTPPCPTSLKRTNGNGNCPGGAGQLTLSYQTCPTNAQIIDSVYINGTRFAITFAQPTACNNRGQVVYCILSGNTPPSGTWHIYFHDIVLNSASNCYVPDGGPLPISISSFFAKRSTNKVSLSWTTVYEQNAKEFEIQRSSDGKTFETIGVLNATNKATGSTYSYTDMSNSKTTLQYRLKLVDLDGSYKYSEIRSVKGLGMLTELNIFPNPSFGETKVTISDITEGTEVQVMDNAGRIIKTISMSNTNNVTINNLQKGMYMIRIINKLTGETATKKLTVIN